MEIKSLILTNQGVENIAADEIKEISDAKIIRTEPGMVHITCTREQLAQITYEARTINHAIEILATPDAAQINTIIKSIPELTLKGTAAVTCIREGTHDYTSFEVQQQIDKALKSRGFEIKHKNPAHPFFIIIKQDNAYFGLDYAGIDLGKREYRIFLGQESLRGNIAAAILEMAEYAPTKSLIDPYCRHGEIAIEAALMAKGISVNKFLKDKLAFNNFLKFNPKEKTSDAEPNITAVDDQFKNISAAKKNAKIAGINKLINFSKQEIEWIDTKFPKSSIDRIITMPVQPSQSNEGKINRMLQKFFEQADYLLSKKGKIALCMKRGAEIIKEIPKKFKLSEQHNIMQGKEELSILIFER